MKIEIEKTNDSPFIVKSGGKTSEPLGWEEMLGLIAALTIPDKNHVFIGCMKRYGMFLLRK